MARLDRKQRGFGRREEVILDAALELFSHPNWESVSIEQIANLDEVGKGTDRSSNWLVHENCKNRGCSLRPC